MPTNPRSLNTIYIDTAAANTDPNTAGNFAVKGIKVKAVIYRSTNATNQLILKDVTTGNIKINISNATANLTDVYNFGDSPIVFPNGIAPTTLTAATATLIVEG